MSNTIKLDKCKSYSSEKNLLSAIERYGLTDIRHIVCQNGSGRWTAVFLITEWLRENGGYAGHASQHGFMSV